MIQVLHAVLGSKNDHRTISMLYGSRTQDDILAKPLLDDWLLFDGDRLSITYVLSNEPNMSDWKDARGFIDANLMKKKLEERSFPAPEDDCIIFVCGVRTLYFFYQMKIVLPASSHV